MTDKCKPNWNDREQQDVESKDVIQYLNTVYNDPANTIEFSHDYCIGYVDALYQYGLLNDNDYTVVTEWDYAMEKELLNKKEVDKNEN